MATYGYLRRNYPCDSSQQIKLLSQYECDEYYIEEPDFENSEELTRLMSVLVSGDCLVVTSLPVFGKKLNVLAALLQQLETCNVRLCSVNDKIDTNEMKSIYEIFSIIVSAEHERHREVIHRTLIKNRVSGIAMGRPKIDEEKIQEIQKLYKQKLSLREITGICKVSLGTVHKYVKLYCEQSDQVASGQ